MSRRRGECGYCGPKNYLPPGWDYIKTRYECLRSGVGVGKFSERRSWQSRLGMRVDPPYINRCGENRFVDRQLRNRRNLRRSRRNGSDSDEDDDYDGDDDDSSGYKKIVKRKSINKTKSRSKKSKNKTKKTKMTKTKKNSKSKSRSKNYKSKK